MFKALRRWWKYMAAKVSGSLNERADPKVQLEQAINEAQEQHLRLKEQAANVIAQQKQAELRLNRKLEQKDKLESQARQAVMMADEAAKRGDAVKGTEYAKAAEAIATQLVAVEAEAKDLEALTLQATQAADQAKSAVSQNASLLRNKLAEKQKLAGQLEQAKMQEQMNKAMASLNETVGQDVPSFEEIRQKIEGRYAKAQGMTELQGSSVESRMLEIEQAAQNTEANARLAEIRAQLGITAVDTPAPATALPSDDVVTPRAEPSPG
ncbi:MAG: PspA/IM30 family protein [Acidimicrobiia bacterium]|nr:PspA/IM30 family protein [Acidimicrobiia bacterium]